MISTLLSILAMNDLHYIALLDTIWWTTTIDSIVGIDLDEMIENLLFQGLFRNFCWSQEAMETNIRCSYWFMILPILCAVASRSSIGNEYELSLIHLMAHLHSIIAVRTSAKI